MDWLKLKIPLESCLGTGQLELIRVGDGVEDIYVNPRKNTKEIQQEGQQMESAATESSSGRWSHSSYGAH